MGPRSAIVAFSCWVCAWFGTSAARVDAVTRDGAVQQLSLDSTAETFDFRPGLSVSLKLSNVKWYLPRSHSSSESGCSRR